MNVKVYQIYYKEEQRPLLQPEFIPYDNSGAKPPHNFEYSVFISNFRNGRISADLTGFLSWKFKQKTGITGETFLDFISRNPGHDVYFINPFPDQACFGSVWEQGDKFHPNLLDITQDLLNRSGYKIDLRSISNQINTLCYCNYWVGSKAFWARYIDFILPLHEYIQNQATANELEILNSNADSKIQAPYHPFIFERLFSTFLSLNPDIRVCHYEYSPDFLNKKYPRFSGLLVKLFQAARSKQTLIYSCTRRLLYFRMYGHKKVPFLNTAMSLFRKKFR